jgi:hypothetical protein
MLLDYPSNPMALSATGRTLRIRRQAQYTDSPQSEDMMEDDAAVASKSTSTIRLKKTKQGSLSGRISVKVQIDGTPDQFVSASVVGSDFAFNDNEDDLSSDDEIFKDVRAYIRQTMGKSALVKAESGICGGGEEPVDTRSATPWLDGSTGNYITVRHPSPDAPIDTPPLPGFEDGSARPIVFSTGLSYQLPLTCKHWFHPKHVSDIERSELSVFGVPETVYRELRDKIIDAYNIDPSKFLSVRNAREATGYSEIGVLTKIWGFLDYWGIINFLSDPSTAPRFSKKLIDYPFGTAVEPIPETLCSVCHKPCSFSAYVIKPDSAPLVPREQVNMARFCSTCINTGSYPHFFTKESFEQIDVVLPGTVTAEFTEEDTMKLIEAIDRYGTDWEAVAQMVGGGKTGSQCCLHFSQIPILDRYMPASRESKFVPKVNPFRDEENPLLSVFFLLSSAVPGDIAAQVAKQVLSEINQNNDVEMS